MCKEKIIIACYYADILEIRVDIFSQRLYLENDKI